MLLLSTFINPTSDVNANRTFFKEEARTLWSKNFFYAFLEIWQHKQIDAAKTFVFPLGNINLETSTVKYFPIMERIDIDPVNLFEGEKMLKYKISMILLIAISAFISNFIFSKAECRDFSTNPFLDSEKKLLRSRATTTLLNLSGSQAISQNAGSSIIPRSNSVFSGSAVDDTTSNTGIFSTPYNSAFAPGWGTPGLWGYSYRRPWGMGAMGAVGALPYGGYGVGYPGLGLGYGGFGYRGLGYGGWGHRGYGWGHRGYGWRGGLWNPGMGALSMGAFGNWADNDELGEMGGGGFIDNGPPSKASGNYYAPSTGDSSAAGNYYSSGNSNVKLPVKPYTTPKDYWGSSGSPFPKNLNKVPW